MPATAICYLMATLALCGVPPFSGFWSKDAILGDALAFSMIHKGHWFLPFAGFFTAFLTAFYMFRQIFLTFFGKPRGGHAYEHAHEAPWQMLVPLIVLGTLALVGGGFGQWFGEFNPQEGRPRADCPVRRARLRFAARSPRAPDRSRNAGAGSQCSRHGRPRGRRRTRRSREPTARRPATARAHEEHVRHQAHKIAMMLSIPLALLGILLGWVMYWERRDGSNRW